MNPNEMKGSGIEEQETEDPICPTCGMEQKDWGANQGQGFLQGDEMYCCKGCAEGTGCTCEEISQKESKKPRKGSLTKNIQ